MNIREICGLAPVVPVLIVEEVAHAALLAQALVVFHAITYQYEKA